MTMSTTTIPRNFQMPRGLGLTLIEVMIVVAVLGVLATIALPSYQESLARGRRAQATAQLVAAQQWMERFFSENLRYNTVGTTTNDQFDVRFTTVPPAGEGTAFYDLEVEATQTTFTITATRTGPMAADRCGNLTLDHLGRKNFATTGTTGTTVTYSTTHFADVNAARAYCWR